MKCASIILIIFLLCVILYILFLCPLIVEMATLTRTNNKTVIRIMPSSEVEVYIKKHEEEEARNEAAKKEKEREKSKS